MPELALAREEIDVEGAQQPPGRSVENLEKSDVGMPRGRLRKFPIFQAEDLARQPEQPVQDGVQREVLGDRVLVHRELISEKLAVVVAPVP